MSIYDTPVNFLNLDVIRHLFELLKAQITTLIFVSHVKDSLKLVFANLDVETRENQRKFLNFNSTRARIV